MYEEDFVSYEIAKKLKEAGFNEPCDWYYTTESTSKGQVRAIHGSGVDYIDIEKGIIVPCFTLWQAQKWLRKVKGIDITISVYREIDETVSPRIIKRYYDCEITNEDDEDYIPYSGNDNYFPSYEAALSAGIDATLELITNKTE